MQGDPTWEAYPIMDKPTFVVTDGKGIVRFVQVTFSERVLSNAVQYLTAEATRAAR
jgi:hypothetical protein